jgi:hypothetical protein
MNNEKVNVPSKEYFSYRILRSNKISTLTKVDIPFKNNTNKFL